ncbi:hypothetical protein PIB30_047636 [Stylosanthes scabra]|uniref:Uncharacterized protein n=1 Tax=Stylosanthes scabra TaxID=79078 RepID=A0ABU6TGH3_9FABA|nr:hypothetical protein [Stylosanthes scabra]
MSFEIRPSDAINIALRCKAAKFPYHSGQKSLLAGHADFFVQWTWLEWNHIDCLSRFCSVQGFSCEYTQR